MTAALPRRLGAEALGTALLLAVVVGSGVMGAKLSAGNDAIALLGNTIATAAGLYVLILIFGPVSGAHFNPAVTLVVAVRREISPTDAWLYVAAQAAGAVCGVFLAHLMFDLALFQISQTDRSGPGRLVGEATATFGLVLTILGVGRARPESAPLAVALFIAAGYWFTSSTAFANPAVTLARTLTDTFAGIRPADAPGFIAAELAGALLAAALAPRLFGSSAARYRPADAGAARTLPDAG